MDNPFCSPVTGYCAVDTVSRIDAVRRMNKKQLLAAQQLPGLQKAVAAAIRGRLKTLEKSNG